MSEVKRPVQIDVDHFFPEIGLCLDKGSCLVPSGIVHQPINRASSFFKRVDCPRHGRIVDDIDLISPGCAALFTNCFSGGLGTLLVHVEDGDFGTLLAKPERN